MAITRTQIAKQLLAQGGRIGYSVGGRDGPSSSGPSSGPAGGASAGGDYGGNRNPSQDYGGGSGANRDRRREEQYKPPTNITSKQFDDRLDKARDFRETQKFKRAFTTKTLFDKVPSTLKILSRIIPGNLKYRQEFLANNPQLLEYFNSLTEEEQKSGKLMSALKGITNLDGKTYEDFLAFDKGAPGLKYSGNVGGLEKFVKEDGTFGYREGRDRDGPPILLPPITAQAPSIIEEPEYVNPLSLLTPRIAGTRFLGTELEDEDEDQSFDLRLAGGGIASLEDMDREGFLLGGIAKGLKKAVRGVKKLAKSPIGKAALTYAAFTYGPSFLAGAKMGFSGAQGPLQAQKFMKLARFGRTAGEFVSKNPFKVMGGLSLLAGAMTPKEGKDKFDLDSYYASGQTGDVEPFPRIAGSKFDFYGGRIASAEGGSTEEKEPVAKKTMPLLDMDGMEKDYREDGGFVPIGRMEKADDVPARLSKNEFVFTADAVRNAGDGDVDKGAEVMYNMMKNLESGGEVSEESQGLEGARKMFQTSQRLEEVL